MGHKEKKKEPLTTSFVREIARHSTLEEYEDILVRNGAYAYHLTRLSGLQEIHDTEFSAIGAQYYLDILRAKVGTPRKEAEKVFHGWLGAILTRIYAHDDRNLFEIGNEVDNLILPVVVNTVVKRINEQYAGAAWITRVGDERATSMLMLALLARAHNHLTYLSWRRAGRPVYMYSPVLAEMLTHTKLDKLPVECLRLPYPVTEFHFPKGLIPPYPLFVLYEEWKENNNWGDSFAEVTGAVLTEENQGGTDRPRLRLTVLGKNSGGQMNQVCEYFLYTDTGNSVAKELNIAFNERMPQEELEKEIHNEMVRKTHERLKEYGPALNSFISASIIYATMPDADAILGADSPEYAAWAAEIASRKLNRHQQRDVSGIRGTVERPNRYFLGRSVRIIDRHEPTRPSLPGEKRTSPRMHWRAGHFHLYWTGPKDGSARNSVVKFVAPTIVNAPEGTTELDVSKAGMR